jgi:DNA helicase-2/ATP-dependent DNA helicase PcrA
MQFTPTAEQQAIISAAKDSQASLMVNAFAGCAKTSTLELVARALPAELPILYIVFNVKNKKEAESRFPPNVVVKTINGLGHGAWGRAIGKRLVLDDRKLGKLVTACAKERGFAASTEQWANIRELTTKAMQVGLVPSGFSAKGLVEDSAEVWSDLASEVGAYDNVEVLVSLAREVLGESIKQSFAGVISFDDQIYMSVLFHGVFPRFSLVLVDEAQDQSELNIRMISRCAADRLIVVGDTKQACYLWRGAAGDAMERLRKLRAEWIDLPLATTFRCPKVVVERNRAHAPGFAAFEANRQGEHIRFPKPPNEYPHDEQPCWTWPDVPQNGTVAVVCRNNAPALSLAFKLLAQGVAVVMLGRDIGKGLVGLSKKLLPLDDIPREHCVTLIEDWRNKEAALAAVNGQDKKLEGINDRADCLLAVLGNAKNSGELRAKLEALFARENGKVTLSSIHRAKGLEWDTVVLLDPWRIPSKYAKRDPLQLQQEFNLRYIAETRSKHTLIEANLEDFSS